MSDVIKKIEKALDMNGLKFVHTKTETTYTQSEIDGTITVRDLLVWEPHITKEKEAFDINTVLHIDKD